MPLKRVLINSKGINVVCDNSIIDQVVMLGGINTDMREATDRMIKSQQIMSARLNAYFVNLLLVIYLTNITL